MKGKSYKYIRIGVGKNIHLEGGQEEGEGEAVFARGLLVNAWRESGYKMVGLQPVLRRQSSMLSRLSKQVESDKGQAVMKRIVKTLKSRNQA